MEDQKLEEMYYQANKNDPAFKKMIEESLNCPLEAPLNPPPLNSTSVADSMAIQNLLILRVLCGMTMRLSKGEDDQSGCNPL